MYSELSYLNCCIKLYIELFKYTLYNHFYIWATFIPVHYFFPPFFIPGVLCDPTDLI